MTTLTTAPLAPILARLLDDADVSSAALNVEFASMTEQERAQLHDPGQYRALYHRARDHHLAVSRDTGRLLYMQARAVRARNIVEFGTSFGVSTLHLAAALRDNGGGRLIGSEFEPAKVARASDTVAAAGLADLVEIREGDALETLAHHMPEPIDLVLLDGAKPLYPAVLALLAPRLRPGAVIIADNADWSEEYLAIVRDPVGRYTSLAFGEDVELSVFTG
ncbi:class I SAM-dependent methyltransferase [Bradyrhizobium sp. U87765 SZCCT0131]|nr:MULTISPECIES: class I SAM-dependent methyltransferase [unclassified Bradyrhizobium]MBR1217611.1 class I SAM-dependent methyltransferase [Bradyrhizobium sp. U87765 SZCCT0131]MBR1261443.1 class I SAM-dependent methyltransferase [Bradyrhizobium sp. U87765 SZCCT0134]MBR1303109.1 class I SAM-dependent methyltransferase [Bradyrhizobium sp. U87765 SZCCT0110]MBR1318715.1 class I SAM-dependent methyltransferase [Bradyrhizobium sp. U87765 SZCCT0109]MBR1347040.1 class I SAM-dependent methyltransferase